MGRPKRQGQRRGLSQADPWPTKASGLPGRGHRKETLMEQKGSPGGALASPPKSPSQRHRMGGAEGSQKCYRPLITRKRCIPNFYCSVWWLYSLRPSGSSWCCHPSFLTRKKTGLLSPGSGWCEGSWERTPHWSSMRGVHHPRTHDGGPGNSMTLCIFGLQVKGCRRRKRLPRTEGDHIRGLHLNPKLGTHPTLSLLQSKFITAFRHILLFIHRETGE